MQYKELLKTYNSRVHPVRMPAMHAPTYSRHYIGKYKKPVSCPRFK